MELDVPLLRDWIIIILGIVVIITTIAFLVLALVVYHKVSDMITRTKAAITSPYYKLATWLLRYLGKKDKK